jgi:hypothetical protein
MKKTNTNAITFAQVKGNTKRVVATRNGEPAYVAHAVMTANKSIWEALGGTRVEGEKGLYIDFKTAKKAKDFIAQAITHIDAKDYNKARKTEPKAKAVPAPAKGKKKASVPAPKKAKGKTDEFKFTTVTDANGNTFVVPTSALEPVKKATPKKSKGKVEAVKPTTAPSAKAKKAEPKKTKGNNKVDFSKLAGKGKSANKDAAALMRKAGLVDGTSAEYKAVWAEWCKVR